MDEQSLFAELLDLPDAAARAARLDRAADGDLALRERMERLLARHAAAGSFLEHPLDGTAAFLPVPDDEPEPDIGHYRLLERIGEGGMGAVYMAEQTEPVRRRVAVKVIKPGMDSKAVVARFEAERQALALMDHPNIARVFDGGTTSSGRPYFVMELVRGLPITDYCDRAKLPIRERLALFVQVCRAVQHAHTKGIIHRDLKPSNVLVTMIDGTAVPKVIDFGIAKATGQALTDRTLFTGFHQLVGTPLYMAPEQAEMSGVDVDTRSDVYSLGVLLYELLTGTTPFDAETLKKAGFDEMRRMIREVEPARPSKRVSTLAAEQSSTVADRRGVDPRRFGQMMRSELDWVVMRALDKDRNRRYETAGAFAADVERYLADEPVEACPPSVRYRVGKFARRNRAKLAAVGGIAAALVLGVVFSTWQAVRARQAEHDTAAALDNARLQRQRALQVVDDMYTQVAQKWLNTQGSLTAVQQEFLEKALAFYEELAREDESDPELQFEVVRALNRVGLIHARLRRFGPAESACVRAVERSSDLARLYPDRPEFRMACCDARHILGAVYREVGRKAEADREADRGYEDVAGIDPHALGTPKLRRYLASVLGQLGGELTLARRLPEADAAVLKAVEVWQSLLAESPGDFALRFGLAQAYEQQGRQRMWWGARNEEAEASHREAISRASQLLSERPGDDDCQRILAGSLGNLGVILGWTKRHSEQMEVQRRALKIYEALAARRPDDAMTLNSLAIALNNLSGTMENARADRGEAEGYARRAFEIYEQLADRYPDVVNYVERGLEAPIDFSDFLLRSRKREEARRVLEHSLQRGRTVLTARPWDNDVKYLFFITASKLALVRIELGDHVLAARALEDLPELRLPGPRTNAFDQQGIPSNLSVVGGLLRACVGLAEQDIKLTTAERERVTRAYAARAAAYEEAAARSAEAWARTLPPMTGAMNGVQVCEGILEQWNRGDHSLLRREVWQEAYRLLIRSTVEEVIRRFPESGKHQYFLADFLSTAPGWLRDPERGLELARRAVESNPADQMGRQSFVWALYRAGDWKGCVETSLESDSECEFVLAMAHWRLGNREEAIARYRRGSEWLTGYVKRCEERLRQNVIIHPSPAMLKRLQAEAEQLLDLSPSAAEPLPLAPAPRSAPGKSS